MTETRQGEEVITGVITDRQMRHLNVLLSRAGLKDRQAALDWCGAQIGRTIGSRHELTKAEASKLIDLLVDGVGVTLEADDEDRPTVQEAVRRVMHDIGQIGVAKIGRNVQQGYSFRGIDQFVDTLSPILAKHGVVLLPNVGQPVITEHPTSKGGIQFMCVVRVQWTIVGPRGDTLLAATIGQALDSSDKAANKAMSAAFKYALGQVFSVPNIGWSEQDFDSPEVGQPPIQTPPGGDNRDLLARVEKYAKDAGVPLDEFTGKFRRDHGGMTVDQFRAAPPDLLYAFVRRVEEWNARQQQPPERDISEETNKY